MHKILDFCTEQARQRLISKLVEDGWSVVVRHPDMDTIAIYVMDLEAGHIQLVTVSLEWFRNPVFDSDVLPIQQSESDFMIFGSLLMNQALNAITEHGKGRGEVVHQSEEVQSQLATGASMYLAGTDTYRQWEESSRYMSFFIVRKADDSKYADFLYRPFALVIPEANYLFDPRMVMDMVVRVLETDRQNGTGFYKLKLLEKASVINIDDYR